MRTSTILSIASGIAAAAAADCAAPGDYDSQGRYSCNPAHQYPNGQSCKTIDGCPLLVDANGAAIVKSADSTTTSSAPQTTPTCVPGGSYDSKGRYSCNPAHKYPDGVTCQTIDGCPLLVGSDGKPVIETSSGPGPTSTSTSAPPATSTATCAAPGERDSQGRYSCNPAHQYPNGQTCVQLNGCYVLCTGDSKPVTTPPPAPTPSPTGAGCAAPGAYDAKGRYSCNPAHAYPNGQSCKTIDGCPLLVDADGKPIVKTTDAGKPMPTGGNTGGDKGGNGGTGIPVVNSGSALTGGMALVAAALALII